MLSDKATELCRCLTDEQQKVVQSQTTYAEAVEAMVASEEAVLESRQNLERTVRQCRVASRDLESRQEESVWLQRKIDYLLSLSQQIRSSHARSSCPGDAAPGSAPPSAITSLDSMQVDRTGAVDRKEAADHLGEALKAKLEFLRHERDNLEAKLEVSISMENSTEAIAQTCTAENIAARKTIIDCQEQFHAAWERLTEAERALRMLQDAECELYASCLAARVAAVGSEYLSHSGRDNVSFAPVDIVSATQY
jgi:hypothetical protein